MLTFTGTLRAATTIGGGTNRKTGEVIPERKVLQIEALDSRGLVEVKTITVPDLSPFLGKEGKRVDLPVRAWAPGATVNYLYENTVQKA